jgi:hypothetical protein
MCLWFMMDDPISLYLLNCGLLKTILLMKVQDLVWFCIQHFKTTYEAHIFTYLQHPARKKKIISHFFFLPFLKIRYTLELKMMLGQL